MKENNNNYIAYIPINFPDINLLVEGTELKADKIRILLHQLFLSRLSQSGYTGVQKDNQLNYFYNDGYVALHTSVLKLLLSTRYKKYISFLVENKLITTRESPSSKRAYTPGLTSIHYKIESDLLSVPGSYRHFRRETICDKCSIKAVQKTSERFHQSTSRNNRSIELSPIHNTLFAMEQTIRFDMVAAEAWVDTFIASLSNDKSLTEEKKDIITFNWGFELERLNAINEGYFRYKVDQFGERLYSPLKMVNREMRQFMYFDGNRNEDLMCFDISNSQIYFSALLANPSVINNVIPEFSVVAEYSSEYFEKPDFKRFINSAADGTIYNVWQSIRNIENRDVAKKELIAALFSRRKCRMDGVAAFKAAYPSVWLFFDFIKSLTEAQLPFITQTILDKRGVYKENSYHCNLSAAVQRLESRIFIKRFCESLLSNNIKPFFTIHDSIYFPSRYKTDVERIFNETFIELGVTPPKLKN